MSEVNAIIELQQLAERLAPLYVDDYVEIAKLCDETIDPSGVLLGRVRLEAAKIGLTPSRQRAREVIDRLCSNPEMWATHGCPGFQKLKILEDEFTAAFEFAEWPKGDLQVPETDMKGKTG